jgi:IS30 family transposase
VESRTRVGDWEGDLIVGRASRSAVATLVDRVSRYVKLVHLPAGDSARAVREALAASFKAVLAGLRLTLTLDRGSALAHHDQLADLFIDGI